MIRQSTRAACIDCGIGAGTVRAENPVSTENGTRFILSIPDFCREEVELPVHGRHMVTNALLAAAAGWAAGLAKEQIASGLNQARLTGGGLHCTRINGILVVDDTYNANPDSMRGRPAYRSGAFLHRQTLCGAGQNGGTGRIFQGRARSGGPHGGRAPS